MNEESAKAPVPAAAEPAKTKKLSRNAVIALIVAGVALVALIIPKPWTEGGGFNPRGSAFCAGYDSWNAHGRCGMPDTRGAKLFGLMLWQETKPLGGDFGLSCSIDAGIPHLCFGLPIPGR